MEPLVESDGVLERSKDAMIHYQAGPLMDYVPYTPKTRGLLEELSALRPRTLAIMHGSSFAGDAGKLLRNLDPVLKEVFGGE